MPRERSSSTAPRTRCSISSATGFPYMISAMEPLYVWVFLPMKLAGPLAARRPRFRLGLTFALEIERHSSADEILQGCLIDLVAFVDVDGAPDVPLEAGVE